MSNTSSSMPSSINDAPLHGAPPHDAHHPDPTIVLVDPTSPDGESSLEALRDEDTYVLVVVLMSGRASNALQEYARHEDTTVAVAAWTYLDQVAERVAAPGRLVGTIAATGPDPAYELAVVAHQHDAARIIVPTSLQRLDRTATRRLAHRVPVTIVDPQLTS